MPSDAQFRTLLKDKDTTTLNRMERDRSYTTEQWAMISEESCGLAALGLALRPPTV